MDFTPRDGRLLRWINSHGFVTVQQAATWLGIRYQTCHRRLKRLVDGGYLKANRIGHSRYVFRLTKSGVAKSGDDLQPLKAIAMGSFDHDLQLVDLATLLERKTGRRFTSERRVRQDRCLTGAGMCGHLPDGLLEFDGQKPIAIELELSMKGWRRLQAIISDYAANLDISEVWYFAGSYRLRRRLQRAAEGYTLFKFYEWTSCKQETLSIQLDASGNVSI